MNPGYVNSPLITRENEVKLNIPVPKCLTSFFSSYQWWICV